MMMPVSQSVNSSITDVHRVALDWFAANSGLVRSWREIEEQADKGNRLATLAKGIYKPAYTDYALSVRQTLNSPYADKEIIHRPNGSWLYPYFQENPAPSLRDNEATNRGLMKCLQDGVPVGVLIQTKPKPGVEYRVLGLGRVIEWRAGYFIIERYDQATTNTQANDAALDWVKAEIGPVPPLPKEGVREWAIRQVLKRRGQARFRSSLIAAYEGRCAISACDALDALEAAHIAPYAETVNNDTSNGLLLRGDLHSLFDLGLISVHPTDMKVMLSPKLAKSAYANLEGLQIRLPKNSYDRPSEEALRNHGMWACLL